MSSLYKLTGRFRRLLSRSVFADMEKQRKLSGGIGMEYMGVSNFIKRLPDLTKEKEK